MMRVFAAVAGLAGLCALSSLAQAGGPGWMQVDWFHSQSCEEAWARYQRTHRPLVFAVAADKSSCVYSYCVATCKQNEIRMKTLEYCRSVSGQDCTIYAIFGTIENPDAL